MRPGTPPRPPPQAGSSRPRSSQKTRCPRPPLRVLRAPGPAGLPGSGTVRTQRRLPLPPRETPRPSPLIAVAPGSLPGTERSPASLALGRSHRAPSVPSSLFVRYLNFAPLPRPRSSLLLSPAMATAPPLRAQPDGRPTRSTLSPKN